MSMKTMAWTKSESGTTSLPEVQVILRASVVSDYVSPGTSQVPVDRLHSPLSADVRRTFSPILSIPPYPVHERTL